MYVLDEKHPQFPSPEAVNRSPSNVVAIHGNLEPDTILAAYSRGLFPWFMPGEPVLWHSPDPRLILEPVHLHVSRRLRRTMRRRQWWCELNTRFDEVIAGCADRSVTWITPEMSAAYQRLHALRHAHCIAVLDDADAVVGGLYGVGIGRAFFAESMFSRSRDASRIALAYLCSRLAQYRQPLIDCQVASDHLLRLGARCVPRATYLDLIGILCALPAPSDLWSRHRASTASLGRRADSALSPSQPS